MAYKSLFLSFCLTALLGYAFTVGLTDPNSFWKKLPEWTAIPMLVVVVFALYLLATWWGFKGFGEHKVSALFSLGFCALGIGLYLLGFLDGNGPGKAIPGQYDHDFLRLDPAETAALTKIVQNAGLTLEDATFSEHWHLAESAPGFRVCVQKGHATALHFSGKPIPDFALFSQLPQLDHLHLDHCGLTDVTALRSERIDHLELPNNQITDLNTLSGCPNVRWLKLRNNQLGSEAGLERFTKLVSKDLSGNPFSQ